MVKICYPYLSYNERYTTIVSFIALILCMQNKYANRHIEKMALDKFPTSLYDDKDCDHDGSPICAICLDNFIDGDEIRNLQCQHCFHKKCIDIWLMGTLSEEARVTCICPTCRQSAKEKDVQDHEIPLDSYLRVGQHLAESFDVSLKTPSPPLMSPVISKQNLNIYISTSLDRVTSSPTTSISSDITEISE